MINHVKQVYNQEYTQNGYDLRKYFDYPSLK